MIIDKIETKRNKTTVYCGEKNYPFVLDVLEKYGIKEGETDGRVFFMAKDESDRILCKRALYAMIDRSEKSKKGYVDGLTGKGFSCLLASEIADEAEKRGLIDDRRYAECYIHLHGRTKGWYRIRAELKQKGVPEEIILSFCEEFGDRNEECKALAQKLRKGMDNTYENRMKLYAKLARRGYSTQEISYALDSFAEDILGDE